MGKLFSDAGTRKKSLEALTHINRNRISVAPPGKVTKLGPVPSRAAPSVPVEAEDEETRRRRLMQSSILSDTAKLGG